MNRLRSILNIEFLIKEDAFRNWRMILFVSLLAIIMISSGHSADRKIFKIAALNSNIRLLKSDFIEGKKALLALRKETYIIRILSTKGIGPASTPPIKITFKDE